ncbi:hypothetical protein MJ904_16325 [Massilia sp. MB5]|nr:hypothetical protein [Massilia sp. MB5]UMR28697.1 hypothetical protein MJ904_16325 [Massilia sp. MB5]
MLLRGAQPLRRLLGVGADEKDIQAGQRIALVQCTYGDDAVADRASGRDAAQLSGHVVGIDHANGQRRTGINGREFDIAEEFVEKGGFHAAFQRRRRHVGRGRAAGDTAQRKQQAHQHKQAARQTGG